MGMKTWMLQRHLNSNKHWEKVNEARLLFDRGYRLRDLGDALSGFDLVLKASMLMSECGCPEESWPSDIKEKFA